MWKKYWENIMIKQINKQEIDSKNVRGNKNTFWHIFEMRIICLH
jgi:hypothetical protein